MYFPTLSTLFIAMQAAWVHALPPKVQSAEGMELASFTPSEPISGWPGTATGVVTDDSVPWTPTTSISGWPHIRSSRTSSSISYTTTTATQVIAATTITVTDNSITWTPTQSISGWPPSSGNASGQQLTEIFTITYTSYSEETVVLPLPSVTSSIAHSQTPAFTIVTVTASPTPLASTPTGPFTVITVTASPTPNHTTTPRFVTITVSEVTIWPAQTTAHTPQSVTLTLTSSSVNESLNSTTVSYSSTVLTLGPPPTFATGTATVGFIGKKKQI